MAKITRSATATPSAVDDSVPGEEINLETLGAADLIKLADDRGIDVGHAKRRSSLLLAVKSGQRKPVPVVPLKPEEIPADPHAAAEVAKIDAELKALGDPMAKLEAHAKTLRDLRATRAQTLKDIDKAIGGMESEFRPMQKRTSLAMDQIAALKARRAKLTGA